MNINGEVQRTTLTVPVDPRYARVVRMAAANVASLCDLSLEAVDDVRMAAEEAFVYACATGINKSMHVDMTVDDEGLHLEFELGSKPVLEDQSEPTLVYSAYILEAVCDECTIGQGEGAKMHLLKRIDAHVAN